MVENVLIRKKQHWIGQRSSQACLSLHGSTHTITKLIQNHREFILFCFDLDLREPISEKCNFKTVQISLSSKFLDSSPQVHQKRKKVLLLKLVKRDDYRPSTTILSKLSADPCNTQLNPRIEAFNTREVTKQLMRYCTYNVSRIIHVLVIDGWSLASKSTRRCQNAHYPRFETCLAVTEFSTIFDPTIVEWTEENLITSLQDQKQF